MQTSGVNWMYRRHVGHLVWSTSSGKRYSACSGRPALVPLQKSRKKFFGRFPSRPSFIAMYQLRGMVPSSCSSRTLLNFRAMTVSRASAPVTVTVPSATSSTTSRAAATVCLCTLSTSWSHWSAQRTSAAAASTCRRGGHKDLARSGSSSPSPKPYGGALFLEPVAISPACFLKARWSIATPPHSSHGHIFFRPVPFLGIACRSSTFGVHDVRQWCVELLWYGKRLQKITFCL